LKDIKAIGKNYYGKIKSSLGHKTEHAKIFKEADANYYETIFNAKPLVLKDFLKFLKTHDDVKSVLEIGYSTEIFPIICDEYFSNN
jgi:hypothetical protein